MQFSGLELPASLPAASGWKRVTACPACASPARIPQGEIPERYYVFGSDRVSFPNAAIGVHRCGRCGLIYKSPVPEDGLLASVFARHAAGKWDLPHDYEPELRRLRELAGGSELDLLDIGTSDGAWLGACAAGGIRGRRSALDVVRYPGADAQISGEFIHAALDDPGFGWSGEPYDVVTAFDVLEHLHRPDVAFANLRALVRPGGWLWIETGCADSFWPNRFGVHHWWYVRLLEHHVFWSRRSLEHVAGVHGFALERCESTRHKSWRDAGLAEIGAELLKTGVYCAVGRRYAALAQHFGREGNQPWYPFGRDHLRAWLRRC
ncbi:MAG: class I SAM-dependent methyltransferase [Betaproteobacteria bacterium]|nr:class I SAM-dependent methyltransferase [Betaproteobacteria bacterium]